jgi:chemotaxis protein MotB
MVDKDKGSAKARSYSDIEDAEEYLPREELEIPAKKIASAPPWIVTFADLTTLMLTFFVLLLSFANMEVVSFKKSMGSMQEAFGSQKLEAGSNVLVRDEGTLAHKLGIRKKPKVDPAKRERDQLAELVADTARRGGIMDNVQIFMGPDGLSVIVNDQALFGSGEAKLKKEIFPFLKGIAQIMRSYKFSLLVEGHTDNVPIKTKIFPSNWELSTVRATTVLRKLLDYGVPTDRLAAVGYADRKPIRDNSTPRNRAENRRVEFKFIKVDS